jgi:aldehyde dehydrogenase (NAD+)
LEILNLFNNQKKYFFKGDTKNISFRIKSLIRLKYLIKNNEDLIIEALKKDLGKSGFESYATEIGLVYEELNLHIKNLTKWSKPKKVKSSLIYFKSKSYITYDPYGVALIVGPFNYPFQLVMLPLIGAISAGNCIIMKPSENSPNTALLIEKLINETFDSNYIHVVNPLGGKETMEELLDIKFDYIFFTGSTKVGKIIMRKASENLIPITLELGGKSPCIVNKRTNIKMAAKRIVWGKFLNAGQTCVAPDYLFVEKSIKDSLLKALVKEIKLQFGSDIIKSPDYPRIVNEPSLKRLIELLDDGKIYFGGNYNLEEKYLEPTILTDIEPNSRITEEEIFGPILPVFEFEDLDDVITYINSKEKPLALYYFSENEKSIQKVLESTSSGGVTINDTIIHVASSHLPFGGVGPSGVGSYHGKSSFLNFSHSKSVVNRSTKLEFPFRFAPYKNRINLIRKIMK